MTVVPRGSDAAQSKCATPAGDPVPARKNAAENATAAGREIARGRLAERMAQISGKQTGAAPQSPKPPTEQPEPQQATDAAASPPPTPKPTPQPAPGKVESATAKLKEHLRPERLKQDYNTLLHRMHERVLDASHEQLFFVPTCGTVPLSALTIDSPNRGFGHDYRPIPCQIFDWTLAQIEEDLSEFTFIDYGAGKGRALLLAAEHPFAGVAGVEFAEELHDSAQMNIAQYPRSRMLCRNVECVLEDAIQVGPPDGASMHFFFNPFSREVFAEVLNNIVMAYRAKPRRLYLILVDPVATDLVDASGVFARVEPSIVEGLKLKALSPYDVAIYRSLA